MFGLTVILQLLQSNEVLHDIESSIGGSFVSSKDDRFHNPNPEAMYWLNDNLLTTPEPRLSGCH